MLKTIWKLVYRLFQLLMIALLVYGFAQTLPIDLALLLAGDTLLYFEIATAIWLAAQVTRLRWALVYARLALRRPLRALRKRARRFVRRIGRSTPPSNNDDGPARALARA